MKTVYLIRHGKPDFPGGKHMCLGQTDLPLSPEGRDQARTAARTLEGKSFQLYSSPLLRALQTAEYFQRPITVLKDLREFNMGIWDGLDFDTIRQRYPELYAARGKDRSLLPPGAEAPGAGLDRFQKAIICAAEASPGDLAVVTHSGVMGLFLQAIAGYTSKPDYGKILTITYENGNFNLTGGTIHA